MQIKKYLILWKEYVRLNVARWMEYRMDFLIGIFAMFLSNATSIVFFWVIFQTIPEINGWSFGQLLFLTGFVTLVVGLWHAFFSGFSPWGIERYIRNGDFDRILLKPVNPFVDIIISKIDDDGFGDLIAGMLILYVGSQLSGVSWTLANTLLLVVMVISSLLIFLSIIIFISTLSFWITRSEGLGNIIWHFMRFVEFPLEIYNPFITFILTFVLPIAFISYYPSEIFLGKGLHMNLPYLTPFIAIIFFIISYQFWKFGLKRYASTGS